MRKGLVAVHTCFSIELGDPLPAICACRREIRLETAKRWVATGLADWVSVGKRTYHDKICIIGGSSVRTPRCATIDRTHIERAYASNHGLEDRERIEEYGRLTKTTWKELIVFIAPDDFDKKEREDYGIPVVYAPSNCLTPGGVGRYTFDRRRND